MKKTLGAFVCFALLVAAVHADDTPSSSRVMLRLEPTVDLPIAESAPYFAAGATMDIGLDFMPVEMPVLVFGGLSYAYTPSRTTDSVSILTGRVGAGIRFPLNPAMAFELRAEGGYFYGTLNDFSVGSANPYASGGAMLDFTISPWFSLGVGALYRSYFGLYQGVSIGAGTRLSLDGLLGARRASGSEPMVQPLNAGLIDGGIRVTNASIDPVLPVFYSYYDEHPFGWIEITNDGDTTASAITMSFYLQQYMDNPKRIALGRDLVPGESARIDASALFTDSVLTITEGSRASAEVTIDYTAGGHPAQQVSTQTVRFLNRNAMSWTDDRRAAAFVTARDPSVLTLSKSVVGIVRSKDVRSISATLQTAMALHEALDLIGVNYVPDPTTPYADYSTRQDAVDFLQFPRQTLQYRGGDCDDLSILYSALLESVGINTAFVTTPGHIFVAVDTGLAPADAVSELVPGPRMIVAEGRAWIPVEVTLRGQGFVRAWDEGTREWNEATPRGLAGFYPIDEAWKVFEPVGLPGASEQIVTLDSEQALQAYDAEMNRYVDQTIFPLVQELQTEITSSGSVRAMNRLGVLYARYGQSDNARSIFERIVVQRSDYVPALLNLGNLAYVAEDWLKAEQYYDRASGIRPDDPQVLLSVARVNHELENYGNAQRAYAKLRDVAPDLAAQYAYLVGGADSQAGRAADTQSERRRVAWAEEQGDE